jgi:hemolysin III
MPLWGDAPACREAFTAHMVSARHQSRPEEWANAASHAAGVLLVLALWPWLAEAAARQAGALGVTAMAVFAATMVLQYGVSAIYHGLPHGRAKLWARALDHAAIYLLIAGSATPFALGLLGGRAGLLTCLLIWGLALAGAGLKLMRRLTSARLSTGLYLLFGWLAALLLWPDLSQLDAASLAWLVGGGLAYMVGAGFFVFDASLRFGHFVWHLFTLAGSSCHVFAAIWPSLG